MRFFTLLILLSLKNSGETTKFRLLLKVLQVDVSKLISVSMKNSIALSLQPLFKVRNVFEEEIRSGCMNMLRIT